MQLNWQNLSGFSEKSSFNPRFLVKNAKICVFEEKWFRLYDGSDLKTYLLMRWLGPDALAVCRAHRGLPVGFLLLRYSV